MHGSSVDLDVLTCGVLIENTNDFGRTVQAVWLHSLAIAYGMTPQDSRAVFVEAQRRADTLTPSWHEHCQTVALSLINVLRSIKQSDYRGSNPHPLDCLYCQAGESSIHTYQPPD